MPNPKLESSNLERPKIDKLWGHEDIIHNANGYCGKLLHLNPNYQCSLHYHKLKHETFTAIDGNVWVEYYPNTTAIREDVVVDTGMDYVWGGYDIWINQVTGIGDMGCGVVSMLRGWAHDSLELPPGTPHRFWTTDPEGAILAEFSTPHSDSDVVRLEESREL